MVQFLRRSPVFRQLMGDLFSGTQDYTSLKRRLWGIWESPSASSSPAF